MRKLIGFECKKIIQTRPILLSIMGILFFGAVFYGCRLLMPQMGAGCSPQAYRTFLGELDVSDPGGAVEELSERYDKMLFEGEWPDSLYTDTYGQELSLYRQIIGELKQIAGYSDYVESVLTRARQESVGIFALNEREQRVQDKIFEDFSKVRDVHVRGVGYYAVRAFIQTDLWDYAVVAIIMFLVYALTLSELEENRISILRCTKNGKRKLLYAKLLSGLLGLALMQALMYLYRFVFAGLAYGFPDFSASIQSVYGAEGCTLRMTVGQACLFFFALKLLVTGALFLLFLTGALLLQNMWRFYVAGVSVTAVSWILYQLIDENSFLARLKWVNIAALLSTDSLLLNYRNIIFFGIPYTYRNFCILLSVVICTAVLCFGGMLYCRILPVRERMGREAVFSLRERIAGRILGGRTLFGYELKKWSFYQRGLLLCALGCAVAFLVYEPVTERLYTKAEIYYKYYVRQVEGSYSEERMDYLYGQQEYLDGIEADLAQNGAGYAPSVRSYYNDELSKRPGLLSVIAYGEYLREAGGSFIYERGYEMLFGKGDGKLALLLCRLFSQALMTMLAMFIWHIERSSGMLSLIRISASGEKKVNRRKYGNVLLGGIVVWALTYIPWIYNVFSAFGATELLAPAHSLQLLSWVPGRISLLTALAAFYLLNLLYLWIVGILARPLCMRLHNGMQAAVLLFGISALPLLIFY